MTEANIIILTGQGDTDFKIVNDEILAWVDSDFPHEQLPNGSGIDPNVPEIVLEGLRQEALDDYTQISIGRMSYWNDRALNIPDSACVQRFGDMTRAINYMVENNIKIKRCLEGYIY